MVIRLLPRRSPNAWSRALVLLAAALPLMAAGCADGPVPEMRSLNPWVRKQWEEDEKYGPTFHTRLAEFASLRSGARGMTDAEREKVSAELAALFQQEQSSAMRMEILRTMAAFPTATSLATAEQALADANPQVRIVACTAMGEWTNPAALQALGKTVGGDSDLDVRMAAVRALQNYKDPAAVQSLAIALGDNDPALQKVAMQSLRETTGKDYGMSVMAWREYLDGGNPAPPPPPSIASRLQEFWVW